MPDWEEYLSYVTGDVIAHRLYNGLGRARQSFKHILNSFEKNITQYLQEEINFLPPREEVEDFYQDIHYLNSKIQNCEEKIKNIIQTREK